jgi:hypothetical protein
MPCSVRALVATTYPSPAEFSILLNTSALGDVLRDHVVSGRPYVFRDNPEQETLLRDHLERELNVQSKNIRVVGSGRIGFSMNPHNFPRRFSEASDIDVVIVDEEVFDLAWTTMLTWNYPRRHTMAVPDKNWRYERQRDLYWGWFNPDRIQYDGLSFPEDLIPLRDISARWFDAFQSLSLFKDFATRVVTGRLYRTWTHVLLYHLEGLRQLREIEV